MQYKSYEVIVVGAGPAGSYAACELASAGHSVAVLEHKSAAGLDICCTGIISAECFEAFGISPEVIVRKANSAKFFLPSGNLTRLNSENVKVCIVDRSRFDRAIANKAQSKGATYFFSTDCTAVSIKGNSAMVETTCNNSKQVFYARAVILATGQDLRLHHKLGLGKFKHFAVGAQTEIDAENLDEVEVYFNQQLAPDFFAWLVPTYPGKALAGLISPSSASLHLQRFLLSPLCKGRLASTNINIRQKAIPLCVLPRSVGERLLVIGDAAGQVKPTTGGGIYLGNLGAQIASDVLKEALDKDNLSASYLIRYQRRWKAKMGREISFGRWMRWIYSKLNDQQIEKLFNTFTSGDITTALLNSPDFSFDWHSKLFLSGLRYKITCPIHKLSRLLPGEKNN